MKERLYLFDTTLRDGQQSRRAGSDRLHGRPYRRKAPRRASARLSGADFSYATFD